MSTAVRINSLTLGGDGPRTLPGMEAHGKREDQTSQARRVRDTPPLVHGSLELRQAFDTHVAGARRNRGLKRPVLHAIVQYPTDLELTPERERWMLDEAVAFVDRTYGGRAVFAARLDRDEQGRHTVDVFAAPRYEKRTKRGSQDWISTTKHGKELCCEYRAEIERRHNGVFRDGPRQVGIALQSAWRAHLEAAARDAGLDLDLEPRREKAARAPDRLEPEQYQDVQDARRRAAEIGLQARGRGEAYAAALDGIRAGRLVPSPHPGEWAWRERVSQRRLSSRADRVLDRPWSADEWADLCRVSHEIAEARADAERIRQAAHDEAGAIQAAIEADAQAAAEALAEAERGRAAAVSAAEQAEQRRARTEQRISEAQVAAARAADELRATAEDLVRGAEQCRDLAVADAKQARDEAETLLNATASAVDVIVSGALLPRPEPGQWEPGPAFDDPQPRQVAQEAAPLLQAVTWPARVWSRLRDLAAVMVGFWQRPPAPDHLPNPTPFDDGP